MEHFASGSKRHYYGKRGVTVYRVHRTARPASQASPVFGATVQMLIYGDALWPTYLTGDNTGLIATDSMRNFIQRETLAFIGDDLEAYCRFLGQTFLEVYPAVEGVQLTTVEVPYSGTGAAVMPGGPERAIARLELTRAGVVEVVSGVSGFQLLRLSGSSFSGFLRDQYTSLTDAADRPLQLGLDVEWRYVNSEAAFTDGRLLAHVRHLVQDVFHTFESRSIQQLLHRIGSRVLEDLPVVADVHLEASNRTWDRMAERGDDVSVFDDARPAHGCIGLRLTR